MKIALLTHSYLPKVGGIQVFAYSISHELAAQGHRVDVYIPRDAYHGLAPMYRGLTRPLPWKFFGVVRRIPWLGRLAARFWLRLRQRREHYDVWLAVGTYPAGYAAATLESSAPLVLRASGEDIQKAPQLGYGVRLDPSIERRLRRSTQAFDRVIAMTDAVFQDFLDLGVAEQRITKIPNGVDFDWFSTVDRTAARVELGWPEQKHIILTTGRNHPKKGFNLIPVVARRLLDDGYEFIWHVVGLRTSELNDAVVDYGLSDYVITHEEVGTSLAANGDGHFPVKQVVRMYQAADVFAFPTLIENFALVQLEAMAAGAAFVGTDAPGCKELVEDGVTGLQAEAGNSGSFAEKLELVLKNPALRERLATNARAYAAACSWSNVAHAYLAVFEDILASRVTSP